jgi:hypothetical protein
MFSSLAKALIIATLVTFMAFAPCVAATQTPYGAEQATAGTMIFDLVFARPLGVFAIAFGTAVYVVSLPFSLPSGNAGQAFDKLMKEPVKYTFARPLGVI